MFTVYSFLCACAKSVLTHTHTHVLMFVQVGDTTDGKLDESLILETVADGGKVCAYISTICV